MANVLEQTSGESSSTRSSLQRGFEIATVGLVGVSLLCLSRGFLLFGVFMGAALVAFAFAYALEQRGKVEGGKDEVKYRYEINHANLAKLTADGVPWDVVGALANLLKVSNAQTGKSKPTTKSVDSKSFDNEVDLIKSLDRHKLQRIGEFRDKIIEHIKVEVDPPPPAPADPLATNAASPPESSKEPPVSPTEPNTASLPTNP